MLGNKNATTTVSAHERYGPRPNCTSAHSVAGGQFHPQTLTRNVRFGSKAVIYPDPRNVCFVPKLDIRMIAEALLQYQSATGAKDLRFLIGTTVAASLVSFSLDLTSMGAHPAAKSVLRWA